MVGMIRKLLQHMRSSVKVEFRIYLSYSLHFMYHNMFTNGFQFVIFKSTGGQLTNQQELMQHVCTLPGSKSIISYFSRSWQTNLIYRIPKTTVGTA